MDTRSELQGDAKNLRRIAKAADYASCLIVAGAFLYLFFALTEEQGIDPYKLVCSIFLLMAAPLPLLITAVVARFAYPARCPNCGKKLGKYILGSVQSVEPKRLVEFFTASEKLDVEAPDARCPLCEKKFSKAN